MSPNDVKVKGGEWELGRDSEPLPFQIVGVKSIDIHPEYNPSTGSNDMAVLRLDKRVEFAQHVKPICVTNEDPKPNEKCITTGWGKQAIKCKFTFGFDVYFIKAKKANARWIEINSK